MEAPSAWPAETQIRNGHEFFDRASWLGGRALALGLAVVSLASPAYAKKPVEVPSLPETPAALQPHLAVESEDDGALTSMDPARAGRALTVAQGMKATTERLIIHPKDINQRHWRKYDFAIREIDEFDKTEKYNLQPSLVLSCEDTDWKSANDYYRYSLRVVTHFKNAVSDWAGCNEGNYKRGVWFKGLPGETLPRSVALMHQAFYRAVSETIPGATVNYGEFSSEGKEKMSDFFRQSVACPADEPDCSPEITDRVSFHPYSLTTPPYESGMANEQGMADVPELEAAINDAYQAGRIKTPDGQKPTLNLSEIGWWQATRGEDKNPKLPPKLKRRYTAPPQRAVNYYSAFNMACNYAYVEGLNPYGVETPPKWAGPWNTPLISSTGQYLLTYKAIIDFVYTHPQCIKK